MSVLGRVTRRLGHHRWFGKAARLLVPADRVVGRLTRGRVVALGLIPSLVITTTGRRSGKPRSNPLVFVPDGDAFVVIGSNWGQTQHPGWAMNLLADPAAEVDVKGRRVTVRAERASGAERERLWQLLVTEWPAYRTYRRRFPADALAIAVHGPLAHGDDDGGGDREAGMLVVTYRPGTGPPPATRRVDGVLVDLTVAAAEDYLAQARVLSPLWPLTADRYVTTQALHDPTGWLRTLRDEHLGRLARARPAEFSTAARQAWYRGSAAHSRAARLAEWYETDQALLMLGEARLAAATVTGLLSRTYFRDPGDAVSRTGLAGADMTEVGVVLARQAEELAARGRAVDGTIDELLSS